MAIVACSIPAFAIALLARNDPALWERPLALLDAEERVLAATLPAKRAGVSTGQTARQAHVACPELSLQATDFPAVQGEFEAVLTLLDAYSEAVEPAGLGHAYLTAGDSRAETALPFCQDIGQRLRRELALTAALGCDQGKFTANAAAHSARPGAVRVVLGEAEIPFLRPLPLSLLPLAVDHQRLLGYLGIRTLGQFADLPASAVFQQFGPAGRLAQSWARGQDNRPVLPRQKRLTCARSIDFDPPLERIPPLLTAAEHLLTPLLADLQDQLQAVQALQATCHLADGQERRDSWRLTAPTTDSRRLLALLATAWQAKPWKQALAGLTLTLSEIQEALAQQLLLFPGEGAPADLLAEVLTQMRVRYGPGRFLRAAVPDALHLRVEQRASWQEYAA